MAGPGERSEVVTALSGERATTCLSADIAAGTAPLWFRVRRETRCSPRGKSEPLVRRDVRSSVIMLYSTNAFQSDY